MGCKNSPAKTKRHITENDDGYVPFLGFIYHYIISARTFTQKLKGTAKNEALDFISSQSLKLNLYKLKKN